jgi:hypothetical protein
LSCTLGGARPLGRPGSKERKPDSGGGDPGKHSRATKKDIREAYECGANSFVSKSDTPELMFKKLRMLPVYWLELNRLPDENPD